MKNSDLMREVLTALYKISSRKTSEGYTINLINTITEDLEKKYNFLSYMSIKDTRFLEDEDFLVIDKNIETVDPNIICSLLSQYINYLHESLGREAGPFFYKEIAKKISEDCYSIIKSNGIDLGLMQLNYEVQQLENRIFKTLKENE